MDDGKIDQIISKYHGDARLLIQMLLEIQKENRWLSQEILETVRRKLQPPPSLAEMQRIASFYKAFSLMPRGRHEVHVCMGTSCYVLGAPAVLDAVQETLGIKPGETDTALKFSLEAVTCLGHCAPGPVMVVDGKQYSGMTPDRAKEILKHLD